MKRRIVAVGKASEVEIDVWIPAVFDKVKQVAGKTVKLGRKTTWRLVLESDDD